MDNRTRYIPAIVMLTAGFLVCVITILRGFTTKEIILLSTAAMVGFLLVGFIVKFIIEKYVVIPMLEEEARKKAEEEEAQKEAEKEADANEEENVEVKEKE